MTEVKSGDTVKVHYTGKLENGKVFDSSESREPIEFTIGGGKVIAGFEEGILGMQTGDKKTITVSPEQAYGPRRDELIKVVNKSDFPEDIEPAIGLQLQVQQQGGNVIVVVVTDISEDDVTLDANHPLAGNTLFFDIELVEIT